MGQKDRIPTKSHNTKSHLRIQCLVHTRRQTSQHALLAGTNMTGCRKIPLFLEIKDPVHGQAFYVPSLKNNLACSSKVSVGLNGKEFRRQVTSA